MNFTSFSPIQKSNLNSSWPEEGLEFLGYCPVCGAKERKVIHKGLSDRVFFCAPGKWTLYGCRICRSGYLDPRPTQDSIYRAYSRYYTHKDSCARAETLCWHRRILRILANGYRNYLYGISLRPATSLGVLAMVLIPSRRSSIESEGRHLATPFPSARLLDLGCGNGEFLKLAKQLGWVVTGVDSDPKAVEHCRRNGIAVIKGGIEVFSEDREIFDVITLNHVIEHVHEPLDLVKACHRLLKPGGKIWIGTPNLNAQGHTQFGMNWRGLEPPRHLILFTRASLIKIMKMSGFEEFQDAPHQWLYGHMAAQSKAIKEGRDPMSCYPSLFDRLCCFAIDRRAKRNPSIREFVAIMASKK